MKPNNRIRNLENSMLEEGPGECPFIISQREDLINELTNRHLGPSGQRLLHFLLTGEGQSQEMEALLRKVCSKIKQQIWSPGNGMVESDIPFDADEILEALPQELHDERKHEALLRFSYGIQPLPGDMELCRDLLDPAEQEELQARLSGAKTIPYNKPADRLSFESVPVDNEETID